MLSDTSMENLALSEFIDSVSRLTEPDRIIWCNGSEEEYSDLVRQMLNDKTLIELNQELYPKCYLHRSNPNDVARTEHLTFICTDNEEDAGYTNNWLHSIEAKAKLESLFKGSMKGRTMYIVLYIMGPESSAYSQIGVEITDSPYVVINMKIMTRIGKRALSQLGDSDVFVKGIHSLGDVNPDKRYICHFPKERLIMSIGSGYGGNALLSKKCHSLRLASVEAREEKWLAEHMLILGLKSPDSKVTYICAAFPSASGKTNLAMLKPPMKYSNWSILTIGDDISWIHGDGENFRAINPEAGLFGVAPGTNAKTNPNALETIRKNTIFTNVAITGQGNPWWEDMTDSTPSGVIDWKGNHWLSGNDKAAHPNSRFTTPMKQMPSLSPEWENPNGVPVSAFLFGGRRSKLTPLVYESFNWIHGVFIGATMGAETTAAAVGDVGRLRRDPMAMRPFCGYNIGDYFKHWIDMGTRVKNPPKIFHVNWFRTDSNGKFLWPGFRENIRVLKWINDRVNGKGIAIKTQIGYVPTAESLDLEGLNLPENVVNDLLNVNVEEWTQEVDQIKEFFNSVGDKLPKELWNELNKLESSL